MGHRTAELDHMDHPLTGVVIGAASAVHRALGLGLLESAFQACLCQEPAKRGHDVQREVPLPVAYDAIQLDGGHRLDPVVDRQVLVEIKSVDAVKDIDLAHLITYLRLSGIVRGLLTNFNEQVLRKSLDRRVLTPKPAPTTPSSHSSLPSAHSAPLR